MDKNTLTDWFDHKGVLVLVLAVALAAVGYWGYQRYISFNQLQSELNNRYEYSFQELNDHVDRLEEQMGTLIISNAASNLSANLSNVWRSAYAAHEDLGQLPLSSDSLDDLKQLLANSLQYTNHLDRKVVDRDLKSTEKQTIKKLYQQVKTANKELETVHDKMSKNNFKWYDKKRVKVNKSQQEYSTSALNGLAKLDKKLKLNQLNLDSVLSTTGGIRQRNIVAGLANLKGKKVNQQQAIQQAKEFIANPENYEYKIVDNKNIQVKGGKKVETHLPAHSVKAENKQNEGEDIYIDVSKRGGQVLWLLNQRDIKNEKIPKSQAKADAKEFLAANGYQQTKLISSKPFNKLFIASFAPQQKGVMMKPETITVEVSLDNGEVIGFDGTKYILNHKSRSDAELEPKLSKAEAKEKVSDNFEIEKGPRLVIDEIRGQEKLCYEFVGTVKEGTGTYKIKINAKTGVEEMVKNADDDIYQYTE